MSDLTGYIQMRFPNGRRISDEWQTECPACENPKHRFFINTDSGKATCKHCLFAASGWVSLIARVENLKTREEIAAWIAEHREDLKGEVYIGERSYKPARLAMAQRLPSGCCPIERNDAFWNYLAGRGFIWDMVQMFNIMKCTSGAYKNRIIVPVFEQGALMYFFDRAITTTEQKTLGVGSQKMVWPIDKREVVFNLDSVMCQHGAVMIAEGIFSALSLSPTHTIALLGKVCSAEQMIKIKARRPTHVEICLDDDAWTYAINMAEQFTKEGIPAYLRRFVNGDPNDYLMRGDPWPESVLYDMKFKIKNKLGG